MRAADLRHRVSIQQRSVEQDSFGGQSDVWTEVLTVWAHIQPLNGRELMAAQAVQSETTHSITLRYNTPFSRPADVTKLRIVWNGRVFNIGASINEDERNRQVVLSAVEGLNDG
jgi:SPP1 family predicted phage head-tail adaptor